MHTPSRAGSLPGDLRQFGQLLLAKLSSRHGNALLRSLVSAVDESPEVLQKVLAAWPVRLDVGAAVVSRGIGRAELPPDTERDLLLEAFLAPIYLRVLLSRQPVTTEFLDELIELLLEGACRSDITPAVRKARR